MAQCKTTTSSTAVACVSPGTPICNICRQEDKPANLLRPCACPGSIGLVHYACIKLWIETSSADVCVACKTPFRAGLVVAKRAGRFGRFFAHSELGRLYSQFTFFFLVMFYMSYVGSFHVRVQYQRGWISTAMIITVFNLFFLLVHTVLFIVYLLMIAGSFYHWRKSHFDVQVARDTTGKGQRDPGKDQKEVHKAKGKSRDQGKS